MTNKQKVFCDEYLIDLNATRAYKAAYPSCKKDETARVNGSKLLTITNIQEYINSEMEERAKRTGITQDRVLREIAAVAFANATDFANVKKGIVIINDTDTLEDKVKKAIVTIKEGKNGIEVGMANKMQALEMLGRHLGMFKDKLELSRPTNEITNEIDKYIQERMKAND